MFTLITESSVRKIVERALIHYPDLLNDLY